MPGVGTTVLPIGPVFTGLFRSLQIPVTVNITVRRSALTVHGNLNGMSPIVDALGKFAVPLGKAVHDVAPVVLNVVLVGVLFVGLPLFVLLSAVLL